MRSFGLARLWQLIVRSNSWRPSTYIGGWAGYVLPMVITMALVAWVLNGSPGRVLGVATGTAIGSGLVTTIRVWRLKRRQREAYREVVSLLNPEPGPGR